MVSPIQAVLAKLPDAKRTPQGWRAKCPGHKDTNPSLDVAEGDDGRVLLTCRAGCDSARVVDGMGLGLKNLFPPREPRRQQPTIYQIKDAQGQVIAEHVRVDYPDIPKSDPTHKKLFWKRDGTNGLKGLPVESLPLYGSELLGSRPGEVWLTEGEPPADAR